MDKERFKMVYKIALCDDDKEYMDELEKMLAACRKQEAWLSGSFSALFGNFYADTGDD
mgnify:CR=1 FL=1